MLVKLLSCVNGRPSVQTVLRTNGLVWFKLKEVNHETLGTIAEIFDAYLYIFLTNVELETLFSTITKGDGELDGDSLDSTWSRFERNSGKHIERYTWPHISCTSKTHGKTIVKPFFPTISRTKVDKKTFLKLNHH